MRDQEQAGDQHRPLSVMVNAQLRCALAGCGPQNHIGPDMSHEPDKQPAAITTCRRKRQLSGVTARAGTAAQEFAWAGGSHELGALRRGDSGHARWRSNFY